MEFSCLSPLFFNISFPCHDVVLRARRDKRLECRSEGVMRNEAVQGEDDEEEGNELSMCSGWERGRRRERDALCEGSRE